MRLVKLSVRTPLRPVGGGSCSCTQGRTHHTAFEVETIVPRLPTGKPLSGSRITRMVPSTARSYR
jgi:hypothetical protein